MVALCERIHGNINGALESKWKDVEGVDIPAARAAWVKHRKDITDNALKNMCLPSDYELTITEQLRLYSARTSRGGVLGFWQTFTHSNL